MSLIDEALRKAGGEKERAGPAADPGSSSWVPAYGLDRRARRQRAGAFVGAFLAVLLLGGAGLWLILRGGRGEAPAATKPVAAAAAAATPLAHPLEEVEVAPPPSGPRQAAPAAAVSKAGTAAGPVSAPPKTPPAGARGPSPVPAPAAGGVPAGAAAAPAEGVSRAPVDGRTYRGELMLPDGSKIVLEGIVYSEARPVALINGRVLNPGDSVLDFTLAAVEQERVKIQGRGITFFLALK